MPQQVANFIGGHNVTFFSYGQTGSGKTYTMIAPVGSLNAPGGTDPSGELLEHYGLFPRTALRIYDLLAKSKAKFMLTLTVCQVGGWGFHPMDLITSK